MSDTPVSERDAVKRERAAFARGRCMSQHELHEDEWPSCVSCLRRASEVYPLPKVERPRVARDNYGREWTVIHSELHFRETGLHEWTPGVKEQWLLDRRVVPVWADLLANPTELVEDDA